MSQANVEIVRKLYTHWERGEFATPVFFDPEVQYSRIGAEVPGDAGEWHGVEDMWAANLEYLGALEDVRNVAEEFIDLGERILVLDTQTARGRRSGAPVEHQLAQLFTLHGGRIVRWESYWDRPEALRAAGLVE